MRSLRRTMLFMPGNTPGMLQNAAVFGADSVIFDLEDGVSLAEKDAARILVRNALQTFSYEGIEVIVRMNALSEAMAISDVNEIVTVHPDAFMLPKATETAVTQLDELLGLAEKEIGILPEKIKIIPLIETAYGLTHVTEIITASRRINGILLGAEDLTADLGIKRTREGEEILYARSNLAVVCRAHGIEAIDTPFVDLNDPQGLVWDTQKAKSLGFTGKAAINPRQIEAINKVFSPTAEEIDYAQRVLAAMEEATRKGKGVFALDHKMIDAPVIARARQIMERACPKGFTEGAIR